MYSYSPAARTRYGPDPVSQKFISQVKTSSPKGFRQNLKVMGRTMPMRDLLSSSNHTGYMICTKHSVPYTANRL
ncbi:hypothetical protein E4U42_004271 [Claviceps africana]|uniref:Uncharacterized protein n=1 Tax=Claviceps africana TaxID=83212 RepID=A0A8K0J5J2_9HYPO|nr:hypothetical protein E4U42_004271 [Claviceps africana]